MDPETLRDLFSGTLDPLESLATGRVSFDGPPEVLERAVAILAAPPAQ
jgi:hypothetical protein